MRLMKEVLRVSDGMNCTVCTQMIRPRCFWRSIKLLSAAARSETKGRARAWLDFEATKGAARAIQASKGPPRTSPSRHQTTLLYHRTPQEPASSSAHRYTRFFFRLASIDTSHDPSPSLSCSAVPAPSTADSPPPWQRPTSSPKSSRSH